jgi:5-methylcytosine-specific restriction endonuclease McrA
VCYGWWMGSEYRVDRLSDDELLMRTGELVARGKRVEAELVAHIAEVDARRLYLAKAFPSMFAYATARLGLSESEAYLRITAGRASRRFPLILDLLATNRIHLSAVAKLAQHLTEENAADILTRASGRTKREILELVAELAPRPDAPEVVRRLPRPSHRVLLRPDGAVSPPPDAPLSTGSDAVARPLAPPPSVAMPTSDLVPIAPTRFRVQFTASSELEGKLARARALLRQQIPSGDLAEIVDRAVTLLLRELERTRCAGTEKPRRSLAEADVTPRSRHIPAPVRRAVWQRDRAQCTFVDGSGQRCPARELLELHHEAPFARGGDHDLSNVRLLCRSHNRYQAELDFGRDHVETCIDEASRAVSQCAPATQRRRRAARSRAGEMPVTWGPIGDLAVVCDTVHSSPIARASGPTC